MGEPNNNTNDPNAVNPQCKRGPLFYIGYPLWIFGIVFTTMTTMNHLKQEPRQPLGFDLTLRWGDGGFIAYGVAFVVLGFSLMLIDIRRRKRTSML